VSQPLVRRNDWRVISAPALGEWTPHLSVSVVIPTWNAKTTLPLVLASLAAQTYPDHLIEVVVVDDGNPEPVTLPPVRPSNTSVVRVADGWGRANACHAGAQASQGDVVCWLDSDMLAFRHHLEAQLRWHHQLDYAVVLGTKRFVDPQPATALSPETVRERVRDGSIESLYDWDREEPHRWVEGMWRRLDDLTLAGPRAFRAHVGATGSLTRALYDASGGMDRRLRLGEDMELGHRLSESGGVLIPEHDARAWHLGRSHVMEKRDQVNRYNDAFLANLVPTMRPKRNRRGRRYDVPFLEVVVDSRHRPADQVIACVAALLDQALADLRVVLLGEWAALTDARRAPLDDPLLETRIVHRTYAGDQRVELATEVPAGRCRSPWRLTLADVDLAPLPDALGRVLSGLERTHDGAAIIDGVGRLVRTAAAERAVRVTGEASDDVIDAAYGLVPLTAGDAGWVKTEEREVPRHEGKMKPPVPRQGGDDADQELTQDQRRGLFGRRV